MRAILNITLTDIKNFFTFQPIRQDISEHVKISEDIQDMSWNSKGKLQKGGK